jgi:Leu/Phe-tRNA-protein transferase
VVVVVVAVVDMLDCSVDMLDCSVDTHHLKQ